MTSQSYAQDDAVEVPIEADGEETTDAGSDEDSDFQARFNTWFTTNINDRLGAVLFFSIYSTDRVTVDGEAVLDEDGKQVENPLPLIVVVLVLGGIFFTFRFGFINVRLFRHSFDVIRGRYDKKDDPGEISHFQALTSALSATVGLGNIASVAIAISLGGPGAVFWMWLTAFFGMSMKFSSCTLAQLYRRVHDDGRVQGGPMVYLEDGIKEVAPALAPLGKMFAYMFAVLMVLAAFGAGNMFQVNQTASAVTMMFFNGDESVPVQLGIGVVMAFLVGIVIIGGIKRIGEITSKLVPTMCVFYCSVCLIIILMNFSQVGATFGEIFSNAFAPSAMFGGFIGVLVNGMKRAAFSNEAGLGSAAIAHAAAKTDEPVREGVVAMVGPFIDTIVVCTMTALTILITKAHLAEGDLEGIEITATAFSQLGAFVPYFLCLAVFVFAYSTLISWGYYAERCVEYLFGEGPAIMAFRIVYVLVVVVAPLLSLSAIVDFADILLLSLAFPNIIGSAILAVKVKPLLDDYVRRLKSGEMKPIDHH
ncbi:MAG: alanine/glycine:cation symporter family protein [Candidatus Hydrogenedentota bacterium]